ncbi:hypothetical protein B0H19DRAFT_910208, partial [Mycena capillaripes]
STSLPSCQSFPIQSGPLSAPGVSPFYMIAFAVDGAPLTTFIGTNSRNLTWKVLHPPELCTQLLLGVVDSQGTSGGIDAPLYTVTEGTTTECIASPGEESQFTIEANVTDTLTTCQAWGLTISGGTPPYNLTIAALNAPDVSNFTLGHANLFTYINRVDPGTQMLARLSFLTRFSTGQWATGSPLVRTAG